MIQKSNLLRRSLPQLYFSNYDTSSIDKKKNVRFECCPNDFEVEANEVSNNEIEKKIKFIPHFNILESYESFNQRLIETICLTRFKIINGYDIKAFIYVKKFSSKLNGNLEIKKNKLRFKFLRKILPIYKIRNIYQNIMRNTDVRGNHFTYYEETNAKKIIIPTGEANLIWSNDSWKTWNIIETTYLQQTNDCLIYEANLKNIDKLVENGKTIEFVSCYQNDEGVFKDTNNDKCYIFERIDKLIKLEI